MKRIKNFSIFLYETKGETDSYPPPEYLVQPHEGETGFFMFKKAFDKKRKKFDVGYFSNDELEDVK